MEPLTRAEGTTLMLPQPRIVDLCLAKRTAFAVVVAILAICAAPTGAAAAGPFSALAGSWSGTGTVTVSNGADERLRCRAVYQVGEEGFDIRLNLRCASDSYNFNLLSTVRYEGGRVSGSWSEVTRNASGTISGRVNGHQILVAAQGPNFGANLLLVTHGNRQSISIRATGADVTGADIVLSRR
jgi:hypothetical protein